MSCIYTGCLCVYKYSVYIYIYIYVCYRNYCIFYAHNIKNADVICQVGLCIQSTFLSVNTLHYFGNSKVLFILRDEFNYIIMIVCTHFQVTFYTLVFMHLNFCVSQDFSLIFIMYDLPMLFSW